MASYKIEISEAIEIVEEFGNILESHGATPELEGDITKLLNRCFSERDIIPH
jgi:hypothetical protein